MNNIKFTLGFSYCNGEAVIDCEPCEYVNARKLCQFIEDTIIDDMGRLCPDSFWLNFYLDEDENTSCFYVWNNHELKRNQDLDDVWDGVQAKIKKFCYNDVKKMEKGAK